jgi:two-component system, NtrC family, response regulator AtoC
VFTEKIRRTINSSIPLLVNKNKMNAQNEYSVFLVDDDKMFLTSLKNNIQKHFGPKLKVSGYSSGEECLQHIFQVRPLDVPPDIVILDYNLKDATHPNAKDGIEVLNELKSISDDTVVIMLSGQEKRDVVIDSIKNGAYKYITKNKNTFLHTQSVLKRAIENIKRAKENNKYLKWNLYFGLFIISLILLDVIRYMLIH